MRNSLLSGNANGGGVQFERAPGWTRPQRGDVRCSASPSTRNPTMLSRLLHLAAAASLATAQNAQKPLAGHGTQTLSCRADGGVASFTATLDSSSFAGNGYFNTKDVRIMDNCTSAAAPN